MYLRTQDAMEDLGFQEEWLVIDVILKRPVPQLGEHTVQAGWRLKTSYVL